MDEIADITSQLFSSSRCSSKQSSARICPTRTSEKPAIVLPNLFLACSSTPHSKPCRAGCYAHYLRLSRPLIINFPRASPPTLYYHRWPRACDISVGMFSPPLGCVYQTRTILFQHSSWSPCEFRRTIYIRVSRIAHMRSKNHMSLKILHDRRPQHWQLLYHLQ